MRPTVSLVLAALVAVSATPAFGDVPDKEVYVGLTGGVTFPLRAWDLGKDAIKKERDPGISPQAGLRLGFQITSQLAIEAGAQWLSMPLGADGRNNGFVYHGDLYYHFLEGNWSPFLLGGAGLYQSVGGALRSEADYQFHAGLGVRGMVLDWLALRVELRDVITDGFGDASGAGGNNLELTAGLDIFPASLLRDRDGDKDGIADVRDRCPDVAGQASAQGCPDRDGDTVADESDACAREAGKPELMGCPDGDGDGVADREDSCPTVAGKARGCPDKDEDGVADKEDKCPDVAGKKDLDGCPDKDDDGITDADDACPEAAGKAELKGCPDKDGDLIPDKDDACPETAGTVGAKGCPDADNDEVADADDACPAEAGKKALKGCPDKDGDGVADKDDKCPELRGLPDHQGCLPKEVQRFTGSIQGINFASGKATLLPSSFPVLDQAVSVLKKYPSMRIRIEGHTDTTGDATLNQTLSGERAQAVMKYFVDKGIDPSRLQAEGFGPMRPIADNKTAAGRAKNRRVEFNLIEQ